MLANMRYVRHSQASSTSPGNPANHNAPGILQFDSCRFVLFVVLKSVTLDKHTRLKLIKKPPGSGAFAKNSIRNPSSRPDILDTAYQVVRMAIHGASHAARALHKLFEPQMQWESFLSARGCFLPRPWCSPPKYRLASAGTFLVRLN